MTRQPRPWRLVTLAMTLSLVSGVTPSPAAAAAAPPRIAFLNDRHELRVVDVKRGSETTLVTAEDPLPPVAWETIRAPAWSPDGRRIAYAHNTGAHGVVSVAQLRTVQADGSGDEALVSLPGGMITDVRWSPDGGRLAFLLWTPNAPVGMVTWTDLGGRWELYVVNEEGSDLRPVAPVHPSKIRSLDFSPDGARLAFVSDQEGVTGVYTVAVDGPGVPVRVSPRDVWAYAARWSPDGKRLAFTGAALVPVIGVLGGNGRGPEIWTVASDGTNPKKLPATTWDEFAWLPDSRRLVYSSCTERGCGIKTIRSDGRAKRTLTPGWGVSDIWPKTSAEGQIAFVRQNHYCCNNMLFVMNADGSNPRQVSNAEFVQHDFTWSNQVLVSRARS